MLDLLIIIQARLGSKRFPNKVMQTVGGIPMVRRVWLAAKEAESRSQWKTKIIVAWPERYPDLDENNVLERFRRISDEFPSYWIMRLTADCPLITADTICNFSWEGPYTANHRDGYDIQVFSRGYLFDSRYTHQEHVIADFTTKPTGLSINTEEDLEHVRKICKTR